MTLEQDIKVKIEENEITDYAFSCMPIDGEAYKEDLNFLVDELAALVREREKTARQEGWSLGIDGAELDAKPFRRQSK